MAKTMPERPLSAQVLGQAFGSLNPQAFGSSKPQRTHSTAALKVPNHNQLLQLVPARHPAEPALARDPEPLAAKAAPEAPPPPDKRRNPVPFAGAPGKTPPPARGARARGPKPGRTATGQNGGKPLRGPVPPAPGPRQIPGWTPAAGCALWPTAFTLSSNWPNYLTEASAATPSVIDGRLLGPPHGWP